MDPQTIHASCVAVKGRGILILGASGSGKSGLALQLMALGASLVADDRTVLAAEADGLIASAPAPLAGRIEARFVGILRAPRVPRARVVLAVDMDRAEDQRLPPRREASFLDCSVPLLHRVDQPYFPAALLHHLIFGRSD
ncbi:HPr kinase/phosphorylase [Rhodovulum adriaticum]|uniref:Hpr(Ser) kinase/phosphatase n=1 Tax=Rhodovulum adriaticum TaxID=35804 RepID=A0A4R2NKR1_RHOAD|nr:HPr kinase/phosphatase C-terminal domain-containing protein [Rhodovulum adriaticum]MBK1637104.1 serine kinase [Rhodovulum adriaticum]TCP21845.1 Hpr(Ser) kinase/phosphatase [Rhodovulum adriaticum]